MHRPPRHPLEAVVRDPEGRLLARCLISRGRFMLGQDRKNEIAVDEPSVSGQHARLTVVSEGEVYIEDWESANGTFVDGALAQGLTRFSPEATVHLGQCTLSLQRAGLPAAVFQHLPEGFLRSPRFHPGAIVVQGRTSFICEAYDTVLGRDVALKILRPESQSDPAAVLRFIRDAQITAQLQHPGVPPLYELGVDEESRLFHTTRFVEGDSLADLLDTLAAGDADCRERFPLSALITVFQKVCDAVAFAHTRGVVHCALRPENITVGAFGEVFVVAWGTARVMPEEVEMPGLVARVRVPESHAEPALSPFTSPEQATGSHHLIDARTDVYALGALLYRILTLQDAHTGTDEDALLAQILTGAITPPGSLGRPAPHWPGGRLPDFLAAVAGRAMSGAAEDRHPDVPALQRDLAAWQSGVATGADLGKLWKGVAGLLSR